MMGQPLQTPETWLGLVRHGYPGGGSKGGGDWDLIFHLSAWKTPDGVLHEGRLRCLMPVGNRSCLQKWHPIVRGLGLVQLEVNRQEGNTLFVRHVDILASDAELEAVRVALQQPVTLDDPDLGRLEFDRALDWFKGKVNWCGQSIRLSLSCDDPQQPQAALNVAKALLREQTTWAERARAAAVAKLLPLKNGAWLKDGEAELTPEAFVQCMMLNSITVDDSNSGRFSFWYDDGDMFWGHVIVVSGHVESQKMTANIEG